MCRVLGVSRSSYYAGSKRGRCARKVGDELVGERIRRIFEASEATYGVLRIQRQLRAEGIFAGKNRVARLMKEKGLRVKTRRRFRITTNSDHKRPVAPNLVAQQFEAHAPDRLWTGDITYIQTGEGWLYLAVVLDVFSRRIVGWSMSARMKDDLVIEAFKNAFYRRRPGPGLIFHSDRGSQYCSKRYRALVAGARGIQSMSATGSCYDNAITETFFGTLKRELVHHCRYQTRAAARSSLFRYIEGFYNRQRIHSSIGYVSPSEFEMLFFRKAA
jgi:transposase InsO family protein